MSVIGVILHAHQLLLKFGLISIEYDARSGILLDHFDQEGKEHGSKLAQSFNIGVNKCKVTTDT